LTGIGLDAPSDENTLLVPDKQGACRLIPKRFAIFARVLGKKGKNFVRFSALIDTSIAYHLSLAERFEGLWTLTLNALSKTFNSIQ
jgi:hypothetical protein